MTDIQKYDIETSSKLNDNIIIDYGIIKGNSTVLFIKPGQNGTIYGYNNKYLKLARLVNSKYGCSIVCSSNNYDGIDSLENAIKEINKYFTNYQIYYLGFSKGASIGA